MEQPSVETNRDRAPDPLLPITHPRTLSDSDVQAICDALEARIVNRFFTNLGKGLWNMALTGIVLVLVGLSVWGAVKGGTTIPH